MITKISWRTLVATCVVALAFSATSTQAALINAGLNTTGINTFQDTDFERIDPAIGNGDSIIDVDEVIEAVIIFETVNSQSITDNPGGLFPGAPYQLTAYSRVKLVSKVAVGGGLFDFVFTNGFADGSAVKLYENPLTTLATFLDPTDTAAGGIADATSGTLLTTLEILPGPNAAGFADFWKAFSAPDDISAFRGTDPALQGGDFFFGLSVKSNPGGLAISTILQGGGLGTTAGFNQAPSIHDVVGNGSLKVPAAGVHTDWAAQTDTTVNFVAVPEPSTITLFGIGLAGLAVMGRRRKKAAAAA